MPSYAKSLSDKGLTNPPPWLPTNVHYETIMGSYAYGVSGDTSDMDLYGFCIPPKNMVFPHLDGEIHGFGRQKKRFDQWQQHHVNDPDSKKVFDFSIYSIVRYFHLAMENNPNILDSLFTPNNCVTHCTSIGQMIREKRQEFLHKGSWHKFKGYAYSQISKIKTKTPTKGKRLESVKQHGFDTKYSYHIVRLLYEAEQILQHRDLDLQLHNEHLKAIRRGEVSLEDLLAWATEKEKYLERLYEESKIPYGPDEDKIKQLLLDCLEHHYGNLTECVVIQNVAEQSMDYIISIVENYHRIKNNN